MCELVETFRQRLRDEMHARGLTQADLAEILGVSQPSVSALLVGKKSRTGKVSGPHLATIAALAEVFEMEPTALLAPYSSKKKRLQVKK